MGISHFRFYLVFSINVVKNVGQKVWKCNTKFLIIFSYSDLKILKEYINIFFFFNNHFM